MRYTTIAIAATFTAEPVEVVLRFWMQELQFPGNVSFAPLDQVVQQLLDPASLLAGNRDGIKIVILRPEDLAGRGAVPSDRTVSELVSAVNVALSRVPTPIMVFVCPSSAPTGSAACVSHAVLEDHISAAFAETPGVYVVPSAELTATYPSAETFDPYAEQLAQIPFTPAFYSALGTMIARKIYALRNAPHKVIAFDADQTLWSGVCGEEGPGGVRIDPSRQAIQEFLVRQHDEGMLLCLCSRNNDEDVAAVFRRPEMVLRREQIVGWRVNWKPKSENLRSLAGELQLGLESFIFLDDDPVECAEIQANAPETLTLLLPRDPEAIAPFLRRVWAFDHLKVTSEGAGRTAFYQQNLERRQFQMESLTMSEFLDGLGLKVHIASLAVQQMARAAELTRRTTQFNVTTLRRSEAELQSLCRSAEVECLVVHVKDRFGDYGLVGVMIFCAGAGVLTVDTFLLSCRALARGIEHRMLASLGEIARERGLETVEFPFVPTARNQPAFDFLERAGGNGKPAVNGGVLFRFPAEAAAAAHYVPPTADAARVAIDGVRVAAPDSVAVDTRAQAALLTSIATELSDVTQIMALIAAHPRTRPDLKVPFVSPGTDREKELAGMFARLLGVEKVGINDDFFSLGGHSLLAMMLISRVRDAFQVEIPIAVLFDIDFTVARVAQAIANYQTTPASPETTGEALTHLVDDLSEDEVRALLADREGSFPNPGAEGHV